MKFTLRYTLYWIYQNQNFRHFHMKIKLIQIHIPECLFQDDYIYNHLLLLLNKLFILYFHQNQ